MRSRSIDIPARLMVLESLDTVPGPGNGVKSARVIGWQDEQRVDLGSGGRAFLEQPADFAVAGAGPVHASRRRPHFVPGRALERLMGFASFRVKLGLRGAASTSVSTAATSPRIAQPARAWLAQHPSDDPDASRCER
jgi:hypothetical protein